MEGRDKDEVAIQDGRNRVFLTTCTPSTFTHRAVPLSSHYDCRATAGSGTLLSHLLPASTLSAARARVDWPSQRLEELSSACGYGGSLQERDHGAKAHDNGLTKSHHHHQAFVGRHSSTRIRNVSTTLTRGGVLLVAHHS